MGCWGGGKAAGKENEECLGKAEGGKPPSEGRDGEPALGPEVCCCCRWRRGEAGGRGEEDAFDFQMGKMSKNVPDVPGNRKMSFN